MKKLIILYTFSFSLLLLAGSCRKDEETQPREVITGDLIWDAGDRNAAFAQQFLFNVYSFLPTGFNRIGGDFLDAASGDALPTRNNTSVENYINGQVSVVQNPDPYWSNTYYGIRQANIFLTNIDIVPTTDLNKTRWKAEVRFMRAFLYFELVKRYGGVPLIGDKVFTLEDNLELPRNTYEACINYIISECDAIKNDLMPDPGNDTDWGRIPKGAAIALKCRVYLYAASPLFNGGAPASQQKTKGLVGYPTPDPTRWQKVIEAALEFKTITYYTIQPTFATLFTTRKSSEIILSKQLAQDFNIELNNGPVSYFNLGVQNGGRTSPTQNLVDAFTMTNGLAITDPASGYNPAAPYVNRDKRLDATVFYNNVRWLSDTVRTFEGGKDKPNSSSIQTKTGYYLRKFMADYSGSQTSYSAVNHNFIYFRFPEIILNQAEALNELGQTEDAVQQIILVRRRTSNGIAAGANSRYGIKAGITQAEMRDLIYNERRVELAFEEHRFWDIRRWKIAPQVVNGPLNGMRITRTAPNTFTYQTFVAANAIFSDKLYLMPLPFDEITKNVALEQNPGW